MNMSIPSRPGVRAATTLASRHCLCAVVMVSVLGFLSPAAAQTQASKKAAAPATNTTLKSCSWDRPGKNPYMGELPSAVDRYTDLSAEVRTKLKDRIAKQQYDDVVEIRRDGIVGGGKFTYASQIRDMHFGDKGRMCSTVTRQRWTATTTERGLVYCESGQCVMVPTVCRNVSRVAAKPVAVPMAEKSGAIPPPEPAAPTAAVAAKPDGAAVPVPTPAPVIIAGTPGPTFADVAQGPVFAFPSGPVGTPSTVVAGPPPGGGGGGGGGGGVTTPPTVGGGTVDPGTVPPVVVVPPPGLPPVVVPPDTTPVVPPDVGVPPGIPPVVVIPPGIPPGVSPPGGAVGGESVVTPIPEPSTWALMVGGLLLVGVMARRRRATPTAAARKGI